MYFIFINNTYFQYIDLNLKFFFSKKQYLVLIRDGLPINNKYVLIEYTGIWHIY